MSMSFDRSETNPIKVFDDITVIKNLTEKNSALTYELNDKCIEVRNCNKKYFSLQNQYIVLEEVVKQIQCKKNYIRVIN